MDFNQIKNLQAVYIKTQFKHNGICYQNCSDQLWEKNCSSDREKLLKFEDEGREFAKILYSLEQFIQTVKGQNNFWYSVSKLSAISLEFQKFCLITRTFFLTVGQNNFGHKIPFVALSRCFIPIFWQIGIFYMTN